MAPKKTCKSSGNTARRLPLKATKPTSKAASGGFAANTRAGDPQPLSSRTKALEKARRVSSAKARERASKKSAGTWAQRSEDLSKKAVEDFEEANPEYFPFLASLIRNGMLEEEFRAAAERKKGALQEPDVGVVCFSEGAQKWKHMRVSAAKTLLVKLLGRSDVKTWFEGPDKLPAANALKGLRFLAGVQENTLVPSGHPQGNRLNVLLWLLRKRINKIGWKVEPASLTRENFGVLTDWFVFSFPGRPPTAATRT